MQEKKKRIGMLSQIAILFAVGVVLIGMLSAAALYALSSSHVKKDLEDSSRTVAIDVASYINHFPSHECSSA